MRGNDDDHCYSQFTTLLHNYEQLWKVSLGLDDPENSAVYPIVVTDIDSFQRDQQQAELVAKWALAQVQRPEALCDRAQAERATLDPCVLCMAGQHLDMRVLLAGHPIDKLTAELFEEPGYTDTIAVSDDLLGHMHVTVAGNTVVYTRSLPLSSCIWRSDPLLPLFRNFFPVGRIPYEVETDVALLDLSDLSPLSWSSELPGVSTPFRSPTLGSPVLSHLLSPSRAASPPPCDIILSSPLLLPSTPPTQSPNPRLMLEYPAAPQVDGSLELQELDAGETEELLQYMYARSLQRDEGMLDETRSAPQVRQRRVVSAAVMRRAMMYR